MGVDATRNFIRSFWESLC